MEQVRTRGNRRNKFWSFYDNVIIECPLYYQYHCNKTIGDIWLYSDIYNEDARLGATFYMPRNIIILLSLKQLFAIAVFSTQSITLWNCQFLLILPNFSGILGNSKQKYILQTIEQLIQFSYLLLQNENFLIYSFSKQVEAKGNSPENI